MSTFHWHVTDSQSFPVEVEGFPELAQKGSYDEELIYTLADIKELTSYAAQVVVVPVSCSPLLTIVLSAASTSSWQVR